MLSAMKTPRMGRPPKPPGEKFHRVCISLPPLIYRHLADRAGAEGVALSALIAEIVGRSLARKRS